ncbi:MAG: polyprenyl synthetase family protein [Bacteroidota bacterium]
MKSYKELYTLIEQEIAGLKYEQQPAELYQPIRYMLSLGGKRLRPAMLLMASELFGGDVKQAVPAALAIEMFHNFTLVHDDIMDNAAIRRNQPTVHTKWNQTVAILSGDLMMIKALDLLCETQTDNLRGLISVFNKAAAEVCEGQQWDMNFEQQDDITEYEYLNMITLKTAVLLGCSLKLGALIAKADKNDAEHLYEFGKNIGIAFQIQDDILDSFGEKDKVGKKIGGDIASNKKTLLLIEALNNATPSLKEELKHWLAQANDENDAKINAVLAIYEKCNVRTKAEQLKEHYLQTAFKHLHALSTGEEKAVVIKQMAIDLMERIS